MEDAKVINRPRARVRVDCLPYGIQSSSQSGYKYITSSQSTCAREGEAHAAIRNPEAVSAAAKLLAETTKEGNEKESSPYNPLKEKAREETLSQTRSACEEAGARSARGGCSIRRYRQRQKIFSALKIKGEMAIFRFSMSTKRAKS